MIRDGRVGLNGVVIRELGARMVPGRDRVEVDGELIVLDTTVRWVMFHKPQGLLTTRSDPHGGRTIYDALPPEVSDLKYVGRLDRDTEGLLLLSNQGDLIHDLTHPSNAVEREYRAWVKGVPAPDTLRRLTTGVELDDGPARARAATLLEREGTGSVVSLVLTEGRKREVRRLLGAVGHPVTRLVRVRFGALLLGRLPKGAWRPLNDDEISRLEALAGGG